MNSFQIMVSVGVGVSYKGVQMDWEEREMLCWCDSAPHPASAGTALRLSDLCLWLLLKICLEKQFPLLKSFILD